MNKTQIGFIGGGNMAASLIGGLIADGWSAQHIHVADPDEQRRQYLQQQFGIKTYADSSAMIRLTSVLVLAVKPQMLSQVLQELSGDIQQQQPLLISIAAGIRLSDMSRWCGSYNSIVRSMPNTPALVQSGATALHALPDVSAEQRDLAETIMRAVGLTLWVETEQHMDAVTAISGSGPAYFFYLMEALETAGTELGLPANTARLLTLQTAFGAAKMALESSDKPAILRHNVTSPGGTTEKALDIMQQQGLDGIINQAVAGACQRSAELADKLGQDT